MKGPIWKLTQVQTRDDIPSFKTAWPVKTEHAERVVQLLDLQRSVYWSSPINDVRKQELLGIKASQDWERPTHLEWKDLYRNRFHSESLDKKVSLIATNDDYISKTLCKHLWVEDFWKLFHSPGAVTLIEKWQLKDTMYRNYWGSKNALGLWWSYESNVSFAYWGDTLVWMSQQKAALASIFEMMKGDYTFSTAMMQAIIGVYGRSLDREQDTDKYWKYYRGLYSKNWVSAGVSWCQVYHESIEKIITSQAPNGLSDDFLKEHADIRVPLPENIEFASSIWTEAWRVDLLASIFNELYARLLLNHHSEWEYHIEHVAKEIIAHFKSNDLWKIC